MALTSERRWNAYNFWVCFLVSLGAVAYGYPSAVIGVTLAQPTFLIYMNLLDVTTTPPSLTPNAESLIGCTTGLYQAGGAINVFIAAWISDRWGRKASVHYCGLWSLLGGAIMCGSPNIATFIVGRFFAGGGAWGYLTVAPFYCAELAPVGLRGLMVGMNGVNLVIGYLLSSFMGLAFYYVKSSEAQWRAPLGIALVFPVAMSLICLIVPESPRYLLMQTKVDRAREVTNKLHNRQGRQEDENYVREEFFQMVKQAEAERAMNIGWIEMFTRPNYRKRTIMAMFFAFAGQSTGVLVLNNYGPTIYAALGYDTLQQILFQCGFFLAGLVGNLVGAFVMDYSGRKPLITIGLGGCCVTLAIEAAMVASFAGEGANQAGLRMGVAATYLFFFIFSIGVDVAGLVFYAEVFPNHIRAKGLALTIGIICLTDLVYLQSAPTAFARIGWKFYLLFIILSAIGTVAAWVFLPETKNVPLEEVAKLFGDDQSVAVFAEDLHVDSRTHELVVEEHGVAHGGHAQRITADGVLSLDSEKTVAPHQTEHVGES